MRIINHELTLDWLIKHSTGKGVQVAVIDSGIDAAHPRLAGKVTRACVVKQQENGNIQCEEMSAIDSYDSFGHGTAVAGVIADLAPDVEIITIKVLNEYNVCTGDVLIAGIQWALAQNIKLINMSLATSKESSIQTMYKLCEQAYLQDTIIVAAKRKYGEYGYPAMFSSVLSVDMKAFENKYMFHFKPCSFIEYDARGENLKLPSPGGNYAFWSGASFAAPHITGIVALLIQRYPGLITAEVKTILKALAINGIG